MPYEWRLNPYQCVECETRQQACRCCDNGQDSIPFVVVIDGCGTFAGRYEFDAVRYKSPSALPSGVSYPATNPCGVFWGTLSAGDGCTANGATWSGSLGLMSWCDGIDPYYGMPWHVEVFCYDTYLGAWVSQGEATVTSYECLCSGPRFAFTLPEIDCCCDDPCPTCTECEDCQCAGAVYPDTVTISDGTNTITMSRLMPGDCTWYNSGTITFGGCTLGNQILQVFCTSAGWTLGGGAISGVNSTSDSCDPLEATFSSFTGCDGNTYVVTLTE